MQNDLMDAVTRKLDELFSGKYPIYTKNVEQGIEMPCFFIGFLKTSDTPLLRTRRQRTWDMRVQFIPEEHTDCTRLLNEDGMDFSSGRQAGTRTGTGGEYLGRNSYISG